MRPLAKLGCKTFLLARGINDAQPQLPGARVSNSCAVITQTVRVIQRAVQRVDEPLMFRVAGVAAALFGDYRVGWKALEHPLNQEGFHVFVSAGHQVGAPLQLDVQVAILHARQHRSSFQGNLGDKIQFGLHGFHLGRVMVQVF